MPRDSTYTHTYTRAHTYPARSGMTHTHIDIYSRTRTFNYAWPLPPNKPTTFECAGNVTQKQAKLPPSVYTCEVYRHNDFPAHDI